MLNTSLLATIRNFILLQITLSLEEEHSLRWKVMLLFMLNFMSKYSLNMFAFFSSELITTVHLIDH